MREDQPGMNMPDQGIYPKYVVFKHPKRETVGYYAKAIFSYTVDFEEAEPLELVDEFVFVLKPTKDKAARVAMAAYAEEIFDEKPQLARDIWEVLGDYH